MPKKFIQFLEGNNIYTCSDCNFHLASLSDLVSRAFVGKSGKAFLFTTVVNIKIGTAKDKQLRTGRHRIADIYCGVCDNKKVIGWKYISTEQLGQKYKEGRFILEKAYLQKQKWIDN